MDNPVAIYFGGIFIYWHGLIMALAVIVSMLCAVFFRKVRNESAVQLITAALIGFIPAILCGRAFYCYFSQESFSGSSEMLKINDGGTSLYGAQVTMNTVTADMRLIIERFWRNSVSNTFTTYFRFGE